jgi:hypothetical protein
LLFLDESSMTVGPNSDLTIDQFVYDPKSGTGKLAMSATRGLLRYVGGKLSKQDDAVTLRTATATLAVRGGTFIAEVQRDGKTDAAFLYGKRLTVRGAVGEPQHLTRPGFHSFTSPGSAASPPALMPPGLLALYTQQLDGRTGGRGGAAVIPTDDNVTNSGVAQTISGNLPESMQQATQTQPAAQTTTNTVITPQVVITPQPVITPQQVTVTTTGPTVTGYAGVRKTSTVAVPDQASSLNVPFGSGALSNGTFSATVGGSLLSFPLATGTSTFTAAGASPGDPVSKSFLSSDGAFFFAELNAAGQTFTVSGGLAVPASVLAPTGQARIFAFDLSLAPGPSGIPFSLNDESISVPKSSLTPAYLVAPASTAIGDTSNGNGARELHATVAFSGQGSAQSSTAVVQGGIVTTLQSSGAPFIRGAVRGVESLGTSDSETVTSSVSSVVDKNGNSLYGSNAITGFTLDQTKYANVSATSLVAAAPVAVQPQASETEGVALAPFPETYGFAQPAVATGLPAGVGASRTTRIPALNPLTGYFGGMMTTTATATPYAITGTAIFGTDSVANTVNATFTSDPLTSSATGGVTSIVMKFGGQNSVFIDDNIFGAFEDNNTPQQINGKQLTVGGDTGAASQLYLVSSATGALPTSLLPSGVSFCQCQFTQWGYWGGDLLTGNPTNDLVSRVDHGHINFWVAGVPTTAGDLTTLASQSAVGTYTGAAIGSVFNGSANYVAAGGFAGTYNFGPQTGTLTISNFDGKSFSTGATPAKLPLTGANYTVTVAQTGLAGTISGSFFGPKAAETGGNFAVHTTLGPTYIASGIFAGKQ